MPTAYLDASSDVVAMSTVERSLAVAQSVNPAIVVVVSGAPSELCLKGASHYTYHRKTSGDGTDILHYTAYEQLDGVKAVRFAEIDARTDELIELGFEYPPESGQHFSLSSPAQMKLLAADAQRDDPLFTYPVTWNSLSDTGSISLPDSATLHGFVLTAVGTVRAILDSGTTIKDAVRAASTKVALDAVVDPR